MATESLNPAEVLSILIEIPPFTLNSTHRSAIGHHGKMVRYKKSSALAWEEEFYLKLNRFNSLLKTFALGVDEYRHAIRLDVYFYLPATVFYMKDKKGVRINRTSGDRSNFLKMPEDCLFNRLKSFNERLDDVMVVGGNTEKIPFNGEHRIIMVMSRTLLPNVVT
jgi:hypothetical protein